MMRAFILVSLFSLSLPAFANSAPIGAWSCQEGRHFVGDVFINEAGNQAVEINSDDFEPNYRTAMVSRMECDSDSIRKCDCNGKSMKVSSEAEGIRTSIKIDHSEPSKLRISYRRDQSVFGLFYLYAQGFTLDCVPAN